MTEYDYEIALDHHNEFNMLALVNWQGKYLLNDCIENNSDYLDHYFGQLNGSFRVTFKSTRNCYWFADYFQQRGIPFILSNPAMNRAIAHIQTKNYELS